jgi:hypothetical protein
LGCAAVDAVIAQPRRRLDADVLEERVSRRVILLRRDCGVAAELA